MRKNSIHFYIVISCLSEYVNHLSYKIFMGSIWPLCYFYYCPVTGFTTIQSLLRNKNIVNKKVFLRNKECYFGFYLQTSYKCFFLPLQNFNNHSFFNMVTTARKVLHFHPVSIKSRHRIAFRNKNGSTTIVGKERVFSVRFSYKNTFLYLSFGVKCISIFANFSKKIVPRHFFHHIDSKHF